MAQLRPLLAAIFMVIALFAAGIYMTGGFDPTSLIGKSGASGPDERAVARVSAVFQKFAENHALSEASLAIGYDRGLVHGEGVGRIADAPVPVASLSKAVTAVCLANLFRTRNLPFTTTLADLTPQLSALRVTPPAHARDIRVSDLVSHTSGLDPDITQGNMPSPSFGPAGLHRRIAFQAMARNAMRGVRGRFYYNNGNYAILAAVIEAVSGREYAPFCAETVLTPAGATSAHMQGRLAALSSFGGWDISAADHTRFLMHWFAPEQPWIARPQDFPGAETATGSVYGLGMSRKELRGGQVYTHFGMICTDQAQDGTGAVAIVLPGSYAMTVTWNRCLDDDTILEFIADLSAAVR